MSADTVPALFSLVALCILWVAPVVPVPAGMPPGLTRELSALRESLARTEKLSARFQQTRHWSALQDALVSKGTIQYQKGGRLVWKTDPPQESELVLEGQTATLRFPALNTTQTLDFASDPGMGKVFETIRAVLQADLARLEPLFEIGIVRKTPLALTLKPKALALGQNLASIHLEFDKAYQLTRVDLNEPGGDSTDIVFREHVVTRSGVK